MSVHTDPIDVRLDGTRTRITPAEVVRLEAKIRYPSESDGCWTWTAGRNSDGYGQFSVSGRTRPAHRIVYAVFVGPIPEGHEIDHLCARGPQGCVTPKHMEPVPYEGRINCLRYALSQTHCRNGHEYTPDNTQLIRWPGKDPYRRCKACARVRRRLYYQEVGR